MKSCPLCEAAMDYSTICPRCGTFHPPRAIENQLTPQELHDLEFLVRQFRSKYKQLHQLPFGTPEYRSVYDDCMVLLEERVKIILGVC